MANVKLSSNAYDILQELIKADNPTQALCSKFDDISGKKKKLLEGSIYELKEAGYINVKWADNKPWYVSLNPRAYTYKEMLTEIEEQGIKPVTNNITIGDNNKITNSIISAKINGNVNQAQKSFYEKHPILCGIFIAVVAGIILMFSFWDYIVFFLEGLFNG